MKIDWYVILSDVRLLYKNRTIRGIYHWVTGAKCSYKHVMRPEHLRNYQINMIINIKTPVKSISILLACLQNSYRFANTSRRLLQSF